MHVHERSSFPLMSVDIRLCGSIPRQDMKACSNAPCSLQACLTSRYNTLDKSCCTVFNESTDISTGQHNGCFQDEMNTNVSRGASTVLPLGPIIEPPIWAVPATGVTRLEPACDAIGKQLSVDLTAQACFRIGRSPLSDIQLMHATSSRRHAMIFHHSNGSCYLVDCGSAHGTFVNGARIISPAHGGVLIPHKVRCGALIRFGGPGAPCFILKSFNFTTEEVNHETSDMGELVRRNTLLNALGERVSNSDCLIFPNSLDESMGVSRKRSFDSLDTRETYDDDSDHESKRLRCSSPLMSSIEPPRLVSPDIPLHVPRKFRRVHFSPHQQVSYPALES